jgi:hypothetical protein
MLALKSVILALLYHDGEQHVAIEYDRVYSLNEGDKLVFQILGKTSKSIHFRLVREEDVLKDST